MNDWFKSWWESLNGWEVEAKVRTAVIALIAAFILGAVLF